MLARTAFGALCRSPAAPATTRALSSLVSPASHPARCGCPRCAPRSAPTSTIVRAPTRPTIAPTATTVDSARAYKVRASVKRFCSGCQSVRRKGTVYILCSLNPKHKQRQG